jgi:signal transduction histidine kinase
MGVRLRADGVAGPGGYDRHMSVTMRRPLLKRVPVRAWMALTWCAAIACTLGSPLRRLQQLFGEPHAGGFGSLGWLLLAKAAVLVLSACLLRRRPLPALALLLGGSLAAAIVWDAGQPGILPVLPACIEVCYIAASRPQRISVAAAVMTICVLAGPLVWGDPGGFRAGMWPALAILLTTVIAWLIGSAARQHRDYAEALRAQAEAQAVNAERLRIARELHDMVAHCIGIVAIQAGTASRVIDTQPAEARKALSAIEDTSRETLAGLRRMLAALREAGPETGSDAGPPERSPGLADLDRLAATTADAGLSIDVQWQGQRRPLPADIDRSAFRIIQESVTNVARHASTNQCRVVVDCQDDEVCIEVVDDGLGGAVLGTGYGIAGMRERVALLHGHFSADPRPEGGFRVAARLPLPASGR